MSNCHNCVFKRNIPGDCHIACAHPVIVPNATKIVLIIVNGQGHALEPLLGFTFNHHGVQQGWANFPVNYDPVWMEGECKLFMDKDEKNGESTTEDDG